MRKPIAFVASNRIGARLHAGGGISVQQALAQATSRLESVREKCVGALDEKIEEVSTRAASQPFPQGHVYALATEIYGLAATFGLSELAEASNSLCDLLASGGQSPGPAAESGRFAEGVRVHVDAMRTLRRPELSGDNVARAAVVDGLRRVVLRMAAPAESA